MLIERNVSQNAGTSAIEIYNSDNFTVRYNETFGTVRKANGADFNGIDADRATTKAIIQYNYIHDNGDGILLAQFAFGDSIVRYNLIINNSRYSINCTPTPRRPTRPITTCSSPRPERCIVGQLVGGTAALVATPTRAEQHPVHDRNGDAAVTAADHVPRQPVQRIALGGW